MASHDPRIDAYIARAAPFAQPILERIRAQVHEAVPGIEETIKWGAPSFVHAGGIVCIMAAFKAHAALNFWKHSLLVEHVPDEGMGSFGKLRSVADLPPKKTFVALVRKAAALNEQGVKVPAARKSGAPKPAPEVPAAFAAALRRDPAAARHFKGFSPSQQRDYVDWYNEAKREDTRERRLAQAIAWIAEGKPRNWKYL